MNKLIIVDKLTIFNLFFLLLYRICGFQSIYLSNSSFLKKKYLITILDIIGIASVNYSTFKNYDFALHFNLEYDHAVNIYKKLINKDDKLLTRLFNVTDPKKVEVALIDMIRKYLGSTSQLLICADYYKKDHRVFVWHKRNFIIQYIDHNYKNLNFYIFNLLSQFLNISFLILKFIKTKSTTVFLKKQKNTKNKPFKSNDNHPLIYFPHKGIISGESSYEKNFFYSDDTSSPFHRNNMLHIEYGVFPNTKEYLSIEKYYLENNLNYKFLPKLTLKMLVSSTVLFMKKSKILPISSKNKLILSLFANVEYYATNLKLHKNVKLALVGYDFLFPKPLSLSLDMSRIKTVAYQERYLSAFVGAGSVLLDLYFMWNDKLRERMMSSPISYIGKSIVIGSVKMELFQLSNNLNISNKIAEIKKTYKKLIIAFDYHSVEKSSDNKIIPIANWQNNLIFYRDLIKLAASFPDAYIIIRGKDAKWCDLDIYKDIYNIIENIDNIEVNKDYEVYDVSYHLVKESDLVIGRYTSIMEESLSYGIPVISHDYGANFKNSIKKMYDGDCCFEFVSSYPELKKSVQKLLFNEKKLDDECIASLYQTIENPKEKILNMTSTLLNKETMKDI